MDIVQENALVVAPRVTLLSTLMYILINSGGWLVGVGVDLYYLSGGLRENWTICLVMVSDIFAWLSLYYIIYKIKRVQCYLFVLWYHFHRARSHG